MTFNPSTPIVVGPRQRPAYNQPRRLMTWGTSTSGDNMAYDTGVTERDIECYFARVEHAVMLNLESFLLPLSGQEISVALDSGDDLGCGLSGTVSLLYVPNTFRAEYRYGTKWAVWVTLRYRQP